MVHDKFQDKFFFCFMVFRGIISLWVKIVKKIVGQTNADQIKSQPGRCKRDRLAKLGMRNISEFSCNNFFVHSSMTWHESLVSSNSYSLHRITLSISTNLHHEFSQFCIRPFEFVFNNILYLGLHNWNNIPNRALLRSSFNHAYWTRLNVVLVIWHETSQDITSSRYYIVINPCRYARFRGICSFTWKRARQSSFPRHVHAVSAIAVCYSEAGRQWQGYVNRAIAVNIAAETFLPFIHMSFFGESRRYTTRKHVKLAEEAAKHNDELNVQLAGQCRFFCDTHSGIYLFYKRIAIKEIILVVLCIMWIHCAPLFAFVLSSR